MEPGDLIRGKEGELGMLLEKSEAGWIVALSADDRRVMPADYWERFGYAEGYNFGSTGRNGQILLQSPTTKQILDLMVLYEEYLKAPGLVLNRLLGR